MAHREWCKGRQVYRQHRHIERICDWFARYRDGTLDAAGLQQNLEAIAGAIEGDIPRPIRLLIEDAVGELELARFGSEELERGRIERVSAELERLLDQYESSDDRCQKAGE